MSPSLADIVNQFKLKPGQSVRENVNGHTAELRLLDDELTPGFAEEPMIDDWPNIPDPPGTRVITAVRGQKEYPSPIHIDESDLAPE